LDELGRPTYLLSVDQGTKVEGRLEQYLEFGVSQGIHRGSLVSMRRKWYFMEKRRPVPIVFAYLGRRKNRFIDVQTEITPLTGFLCVYPNQGVDKQLLLKALNHSASIDELSRIGKSYGDGAVKVEPGGLRRMIIPKVALEESGLVQAL
jgi:adenine-specific DNA-methyltransferase